MNRSMLLREFIIYFLPNKSFIPPEFKCDNVIKNKCCYKKYFVNPRLLTAIEYDATVRNITLLPLWKRRLLLLYIILGFFKSYCHCFCVFKCSYKSILLKKVITLS